MLTPCRKTDGRRHGQPRGRGGSAQSLVRVAVALVQKRRACLPSSALALRRSWADHLAALQVRSERLTYSPARHGRPLSLSLSARAEHHLRARAVMRLPVRSYRLIRHRFLRLLGDVQMRHRLSRKAARRDCRFLLQDSLDFPVPALGDDKADVEIVSVGGELPRKSSLGHQAQQLYAPHRNAC